MIMTLFDKIMALYPGQLTSADFVSTIILVDNADGSPSRIAQWKHPTLPRPTQTQLDALKEQPLAVVTPLVEAAVQARLDAFARSRGYDSIAILCSYASSAHPRFGAEGRYGVAARDAHWQKYVEVMSEVQAGLRPTPTVDEVIAEMPTLSWPT